MSEKDVMTLVHEPMGERTPADFLDSILENITVFGFSENGGPASLRLPTPMIGYDGTAVQIRAKLFPFVSRCLGADLIMIMKEKSFRPATAYELALLHKCRSDVAPQVKRIVALGEHWQVDDGHWVPCLDFASGVALRGFYAGTRTVAEHVFPECADNWALGIEEVSQKKGG